MPGDDHHMAPMDYWENIEDYRSDGDVELPDGVDRSDLQQTAVDIVRERTEDDWTIVGVLLADSDDQGTMYLLVLRTKMGESGDRLLDERYFSLDPTDPYKDGSGYSSNGITRRIAKEGTLLGLKVLYSAVSNGLDHLQNAQIMEAVDGQLHHRPESLTEDMADMLGLSESEPQPDEPEKVVCRRCNEPMDPEVGVKMTGDLGDIWVHDPECPENGGESDG